MRKIFPPLRAVWLNDSGRSCFLLYAEVVFAVLVTFFIISMIIYRNSVKLINEKERFLMIKLYENGVYLLNGTEIVEDTGSAQVSVSRRRSSENTIAYGVGAHNTSSDMKNRQVKFDKLTSHDITFVGIIQTAVLRVLKFRFHMY